VTVNSYNFDSLLIYLSMYSQLSVECGERLVMMMLLLFSVLSASR